MCEKHLFFSIYCSLCDLLPLSVPFNLFLEGYQSWRKLDEWDGGTLKYHKLLLLNINYPGQEVYISCGHQTNVFKTSTNHFEFDLLRFLVSELQIATVLYYCVFLRVFVCVFMCALCMNCMYVSEGNLIYKSQ